MPVSTLRNPGRLAFLAAAVAALVLGRPAAAQPPDPGAEELVKLRLEAHTLRARQEAAEAERPAAILTRGGSLGQFQDPSQILTALRDVLTGSYQTLTTSARNLAEAAQQRRAQVQSEWAEVYRQKIAFRAHIDAQEAAYGFDFDTGALPEPVFTPLDAGAVVWAALVYIVALRLAGRVRRLEVRKAERIAPVAALLLFLAGVSGCGGPASDGRTWAEHEREEAAAARDAAGKNAKDAEDAADAKWTAAMTSRAALADAKGDEAVKKIVVEGETETRKQLLVASRETRLADRLAKEADEEKEKLAADRTKLDELTAGAKLRTVIYTGARCGAAGLLFALAVMPYWRAVRRQAALIRADARKCPRCFSQRLEVEKHAKVAAGEDESPRGAKGKKLTNKPKPKAAPAAYEETGYVECKACGFRFPRRFQYVRRLCFPVVGVRASGKTQMLATGYDQVRKQTAPTIATLQPAVSLGDELFNQIIEMILADKRDPSGNPHVMPDPVMLEVADAEGNTALLNLFDYAGELVNRAVDMDNLKKQAVKMDGFMLFLDPTQLDGKGEKVTLERQLVALNQFMSDMRKERGVGVGRKVSVPVAVCITKFDLLTRHNPIQKQAIPVIRHLNRELTPAEPDQLTLEMIEKRSDLVKDYLPLIFRGVNIVNVIEKYVDSQVMFFPVSSVSLIERELGETNLKNRAIVPFGVAEPFLWLLHMHGYEVFA